MNHGRSVLATNQQCIEAIYSVSKAWRYHRASRARAQSCPAAGPKFSGSLNLGRVYHEQRFGVAKRMNGTISLEG